MPGITTHSLAMSMVDSLKLIQKNMAGSDDTRKKFADNLIKIGVSERKARWIASIMPTGRQQALLNFDVEDGSFTEAVLPDLQRFKGISALPTPKRRIKSIPPSKNKSAPVMKAGLVTPSAKPSAAEEEGPPPAKPIKPPPKLPSNFWPIARVVAAALALIAVTMLTIIGIRRRRRVRAREETFDPSKAISTSEQGIRLLKKIHKMKAAKLMASYKKLQSAEAAEYFKGLTERELGAESERVGFKGLPEMVEVANRIVASQKHQEGNQITLVDLKRELKNLREGNAEPFLKPPAVEYSLGESFMDRMEDMASEHDNDDPDKTKGPKDKGSDSPPARDVEDSSDGRRNSTSNSLSQSEREMIRDPIKPIPSEAEDLRLDELNDEKASEAIDSETVMDEAREKEMRARRIIALRKIKRRRQAIEQIERVKAQAAERRAVLKEARRRQSYRRDLFERAEELGTKFDVSRFLTRKLLKLRARKILRRSFRRSFRR